MASLASSQQKLNWVSVGQGAIGLLAACRLKMAGYPVALWLRQPQPLTVAFHAYQTTQQVQTPCYFTAATAPISYVFIAVKAYAVADCLRQLAPHLAPDCQIIISHNGMPDLALLHTIGIAEQGVWFLTTSHGALRTACTLEHTGLGQSILSPLNAAAKQAQAIILPAMQHALGPCQLTADIKPALWQKLAVNAAINPLTAIHNCRNGALAQAQFSKQIRNIVTEVCQLAALEQVKLDLNDTQANVLQVIERTAENFSSMQQDRFYGRPLELEAITGFILKIAAKHGVPATANSALWQALDRLNQQNLH